MVFGFGKKKKAEVPPIQDVPSRTIQIDDIPAIIKELESPRIASTLHQSQNLKKDIENVQLNIYGIIEELESDNLNLDDVDKNLRIVAKRGKDAVVSIIKKETRSKLNKIEDYENLVRINSDVAQTIKRIGDILGLHTRVMHVFARKYADKLKDEISKLTQLGGNLQRLITEQEKFMSDCQTILDTKKRITDLKNEEIQKKDRLEEVKQEISQSKRKIDHIEKEISDLRKRPEYQEFTEIKKKIEKTSGEKYEIKALVDAQFSRISRPLNKYSYVSSFDKPLKILLEELVSDPYKAITPQTKESIIEILQTAIKSIVARNVHIKDPDKSIDLLEDTVNKMDEFVNLKNAHNKKMSELESNLKVFDIKILDSKYDELEKIKSNLSELEASHIRLQNEIKDCIEQRIKARGEIEEKIGILCDGTMTIKIHEFSKEAF